MHTQRFRVLGSNLERRSMCVGHLWPFLRISIGSFFLVILCKGLREKMYIILLKSGVL